MSDSSDEDMPELESVASSEYLTDDDEDLQDDFSDIPLIPRVPWEPKPPIPEYDEASGVSKEHFRIAKQWLEQDKIAIDRQLNVIAVYLFSPFLYGHAHQSDGWLRWCQEAGLLSSDTSFRTDCLNEVDRSAVELLENALLFCKNTLSNRRSPDALSRLLQLASQVQPPDKTREPPLARAVKTAGENSWFVIMVKDVQTNGSHMSLLSQVAIELGCLYVVNQAAEHVIHHVEKGRDYHKEFQDKVQADLEAMEDLKKMGDDLYNEKKHKEAIDIYSTAIACCPYNYKLYTNRALTYMEMKDYKSSLSDGLRAVILNPSFPKGYIRYIVALKACKETELLLKITDEYGRRFTGCKDRELLKIAMEKYAASVKHVEASSQDLGLLALIKMSCRSGSHAFLRGNTRTAINHYRDAMDMINTDKGVRLAMPPIEWKKFCVILCYCLALSNLKDGREASLQAALKGFEGIISEYRGLHFAPAHMGAAQVLVKLNQHTQALVMARNGLSELPLNRMANNITWPGTNTPILEAIPANVEGELQHICSICEPVCVPDAVCRYPTCTQHNKSANITIVSEDYKGHVLLVCSDSCSIAYHPSCWRRFKNESIINSDRDFLLTPCPTPDCCGEVASISVFDLKGKCKIKFEPPANKALTNGGDSQYSKKKNKKKDSKPAKSQKTLKKNPSSESDSVKDEPVKKNSTDSGIETLVAKESPTASVDSPSATRGSPTTSRDSPSLAGDSPSPTVEDDRKLEDTVGIINRQAEADLEENKENIRVKPKKKKEKKVLTELGFAFTERPLAVSDNTPDDEQDKRSVKWVPDSDAPFQTPAHLKEAIEEFESGKTAVKRVDSQPPPSAKKKRPDDLEFIFSYFREVFLCLGALHPSDPRLDDAMELLPEDKRTIIESSGGLKNFLLMSPSFKTHGELICLFEDSCVVAASIKSEDSFNKLRKSEKDLGRVAERTENGASKLEQSRKTKSSSVQLPKAVSDELSKPFPPELISEETQIPTFVQALPKDEKERREQAGGIAEHFMKCMSVLSENLSPDAPEPSAEQILEILKDNGLLDVETVAQSIYQEDLAKANAAELGFTKPDSIELVNGIEKGSSDEKLKKIDKTQSELVMGSRSLPPSGIASRKPLAPPKLVSKGVSARPVTKNKYTFTDPMPPVENYKERYEIALKEKTDLQTKLERSEDQKFKMARDHKRELEKTQKQAKAEAKESYQFRIEELERRVVNEKEKLNSEKKDHNELTKSLKTEIKSLSDKVEKVKREAAKKEKHSESSLVHTRAQLEDSNLERAKLDERLAKQTLLTQQSLRRAVEAEVELLTMRRDIIQRPLELRLREIDGIMMNLPKDHEFYREWEMYKEKLKTALDCFSNAMEDQVKQIRSGRLLTKLDPVPNPAVPLKPQLASFRMPLPMRPPFMPMMVRPPSSGLDHAPGPRPALDNKPRPIIGPNPPGAMSQPIGPGPIKPPVSLGINDHSPSLPDQEHPIGRKMSSFDRIVEKLSPNYPQFHKGDFKNVLREVRRNNGDTLSGLSLDNIATQIMAILDSRTGGMATATPSAVVKPFTAGGVMSGKGKRGKASGGLYKLPPVATAEPPRISDVEYDNDGWCIICYEDMGDDDSSTLNCGHRFHSECIRSWFNEQSTCPTCRNHSLLPDEYPSLK